MFSWFHVQDWEFSPVRAVLVFYTTNSWVVAQPNFWVGRVYQITKLLFKTDIHIQFYTSKLSILKKFWCLNFQKFEHKSQLLKHHCYILIKIVAKFAHQKSNKVNNVIYLNMEVVSHILYWSEFLFQKRAKNILDRKINERSFPTQSLSLPNLTRFNQFFVLYIQKNCHKK